MQAGEYDVAIAGGGLAGGLTALALQTLAPELRLILIEEGPAPGGKHRWSWFDGDMSAEAQAFMQRFALTIFPGGYDVRFPGFTRHVGGTYLSLDSDSFARTIADRLPPGALRTSARVRALDATGVDLADGERITAATVIDCRGITEAPQLHGGWQVFLGRTLRCDCPHGVADPVVMDADLAQPGAYRFIYVLPLDERTLLVEDTCYADSPALDCAALRTRIDAYCDAHGWGGTTLDEETGVLPVVTGGDFAAFRAAHAVPGVTLAGVRGGFFHPLTSYSLPWAVAGALAMARAIAAGTRGPALALLMERRAAAHWRAMGFYRTLGAMLLGAGDAAERWRVFARFYRLPADLIARFYAGRSTLLDKARLLAGKPPVPVLGALRALRAPGRPLGAAA